MMRPGKDAATERRAPVADYLGEHVLEVLRVGARTLPLGEAADYVRSYVASAADGPRSTTPFAYPAYDGYPGSAGPELAPQDLFAPALLNVPLYSLRTYYELLDALPRINERLRSVPARLSLADAGDDVLARATQVYEVLDGPDAPFGVSMTTLAKIVHRKRPQLLPLWDDHIAECYLRVGPQGGPRIQPDSRRGWRDFATVWMPTVRQDLREHLEAWDALARLTPAHEPSITPLRALDIVGWHLGQPPAV